MSTLAGTTECTGMPCGPEFTVAGAARVTGRAGEYRPGPRALNSPTAPAGKMCETVASAASDRTTARSDTYGSKTSGGY